MNVIVKNISMGSYTSQFTYLVKPDAGEDSEDKYGSKGEAHGFESYTEAGAWADSQTSGHSFAIIQAG